MYKLTTVILFLTLFTQAQSIKIVQVTPYSVCPGDTMTVCFTWDGKGSFTNFTMHNPAMNQVWNFANNTFFGLNKFLAGNDTVYIIKLHTHSIWPLGVSSFGTEWKYTYPISFECIRTGINENESERKDVYKDLNGNVIDFRTNELIIKNGKLTYAIDR